MYNEGLMSTPEGTVCSHPGKLLVLRATPLQGMCEHKSAANSLNSVDIGRIGLQLHYWKAGYDFCKPTAYEIKIVGQKPKSRKRVTQLLPLLTNM